MLKCESGFSVAVVQQFAIVPVESVIVMVDSLSHHSQVVASDPGSYCHFVSPLGATSTRQGLFMYGDSISSRFGNVPVCLSPFSAEAT